MSVQVLTHRPERTNHNWAQHHTSVRADRGGRGTHGRAHTEFVYHTLGFAPAGTAGTAAEALRSVIGLRKTGRPVDSILLDVNLPDATGLVVARRLRGAGEDVDTLAVTAHGYMATVRAAGPWGWWTT